MNLIKVNEIDNLKECDICFMEIPISEAKSEEATEYIIYYWGLDCYYRWKNQSENKGNS